MSRPKIKLFLAGGTIGMLRNRQTGALEPANNINSILEVIPEIQKELKIDVERLMNLDSTNMRPEDWEILARSIEKNYDQYDGFVIAQGTDTMAYTASALSFALQGLCKPIIFTGALMPLNEIGSDGRNNLIYAFRMATEDLAEVAIVFGDKILRGNRATKYKEGMFDVFHSPRFPLLGEIQRPIQLNEWRKKRRKRIPEFQTKFNSKVAVIKIFPGLNPKTIQSIVECGTEGIVLEGFGPGNIPAQMIESLEKHIKKGIPVVVTTQMEEGQTNLKAYAVGYKALETGVIEAKDMTTEACVTKLMWCLAQTKDLSKIQKMMQTNYSGEINT